MDAIIVTQSGDAGLLARLIQSRPDLIQEHGWEGGDYGLGFIRITQSLMNRKNPIVTSDYPTAPYVENIGVRPDIPVDYMTRENLIQGGKPFVDTFVAAMVDYIRKNK